MLDTGEPLSILTRAERLRAQCPPAQRDAISAAHGDLLTVTELVGVRNVTRRRPAGPRPSRLRHRGSAV